MTTAEARSRQLRVKWSSRERCLEYHFPTRKADGGMLAHAFEGQIHMHGKTLVKELEERGYNVKTLRFSIELYPPPPPPPAVMARAGAEGVDGDGRCVDD
jgi:hypothetical protein